MAEARILIFADDPERKPRMYVCPKCGTAHSPKIYMAREEVQHASAREAAENCYTCREHNTCADCGSQCPKHMTRCDACHKQCVLAKATKVEASEIDHCFGYSGEFYHSPDEAMDAGEEFVFAATFRPFQLRQEDVIQSIIDDHHDDASPDDLNGVVALLDAVEQFNEAQTSGSYDEDRSRVAMLSHELERKP